MPTYVTLLKYTEQGIKNIKESPSRLEKARQLLKSLGGELKSFYLVQGRFDAQGVSFANAMKLTEHYLDAYGRLKP